MKDNLFVNKFDKELIDRGNTVLSCEKEGLAALSVSSPDKISCRLGLC